MGPVSPRAGNRETGRVKPAKGAGRILWRRLDVPGHDAASLREWEGGAELRGTAVFQDDRGPAALDYMVHCDAKWHTIEAAVEGWSGDRTIELRFQRTHAGDWTLNGVLSPGVAGCIDLDLNFTPATNLLPLKRLELPVGQTAEVRSAWLEWPEAVLRPLIQHYTRRSTFDYDYSADLPGGDKFVGVLRVDPLGWVLQYADLWQAVDAFIPASPERL